MIARIENKSFYGIPPSPVAPEATSAVIQPVVTSANSLVFQFSPELQSVVGDGESIPALASDTQYEDESLYVQTDLRDRLTSANPSSRRPNMRPSRSRDRESQSLAVDMAYRQDEKTWRDWHEQELLGIFSRLIPKRRMSNLVCE
jgi:hypothetical protein